MRFLSVESFGRGGKTSAPILNKDFPPSFKGVSFSIESNTFCNSLPKKIDIIAGGASFAPKRKSLPALATETLNRS